MRKILALCILATAPILAAENGAMTPAERAFLIEQLEKSKADFLASIAGVRSMDIQARAGRLVRGRVLRTYYSR